jgi:RNA polymerase sigma factor (TIGR02999 family)
MTGVTQILASIERGDPHAAEQLLPLVYEELRRLAAAKIAQEAAGQTLQATALVHEAYLRLVAPDQAQRWETRGHFFSAAAEAMRRILVEQARRKAAVKHGGGYRRVELVEADAVTTVDPGELLAVDEALVRLAAEDSQAAELVKLRYFAGLSVDEAADTLHISRATAYRHWAYARAWLRCEILGDDASPRD